MRTTTTVMPHDPSDRNFWAKLRRVMREQKRNHQTFLAMIDMSLRRNVRPTNEKPPAGLGSLTPTEHDVIKRIVRTDDKLSVIWDAMGMSKRTFDTHLDSIYTKLEVRKRSGLVRQAMTWGLA
jgi:DNA-binding CsgD family transcriptional regulator